MLSEEKRSEKRRTKQVKLGCLVEFVWVRKISAQLEMTLPNSSEGSARVCKEQELDNILTLTDGVYLQHTINGVEFRISQSYGSRHQSRTIFRTLYSDQEFNMDCGNTAVITLNPSEKLKQRNE